MMRSIKRARHPLVELGPGLEKPTFSKPVTVVGLHVWFWVATLPLLLPGLLSRGSDSLAGGQSFDFFWLAVVSLLVSLAWHALFAVVRSRPIDPAWFMHGWLFSLLVPTDLSTPMAMMGISLGVVFGSLIFGGTGRYLVSPALLGTVLLATSYPHVFGRPGLAVEPGFRGRVERDNGLGERRAGAN